MNRLLIVFLFVLISLPILAQVQDTDGDGWLPENRSPFNGVQWENDETMFVLSKDKWYKLEKIDELTIRDLIKTAQDFYGIIWQQKLSYDFSNTINELKIQMNEGIVLKMRDTTTNKRVNDKIWFSEERNEIAKRYYWNNYKNPSPEYITKKQAKQDLFILFNMIKKFEASAIPFEQILKSEMRYLQQNLEEEVNVMELGGKINELLKKVSDLDAKVEGYEDLRKETFLTFVDYNDSLSLMMEFEQTHPFDKAFPFVKYLKKSNDSITYTPFLENQYDEFYLMREEHLMTFDSICLVNEIGKEKMIEVSVLDFSYEPERKKATFLKLADYAFVHIPRISGNSVLIASVEDKLRELNTCKELILDLRNVGEGNRLGAIRIAEMFAKKTDNNVVEHSVYRTNDTYKNPEGYLESYLTYPLVYTEEKIGNVSKNGLLSTFENDGRYSEEHYMLLAGQDIWTKPVTILCNQYTKKEGALLVKYLRNLPNVTVIGTPQNYTDSRVRYKKLPNSKLRIGLSSIVSIIANNRDVKDNMVEPTNILKAKNPFLQQVMN